MNLALESLNVPPALGVLPALIDAAIESTATKTWPIASIGT